MSKPLCLDLYCKAGGTSRGYQQAGFYVVGVDIESQKNYIGDDFLQADALEVLRILIGGGCIIGQSGREYHLSDFSLIAASPPCQGYSRSQPIQGNTHPMLIEPLRELLLASGKPYVIENVEGAPLVNTVMLCGTMFNLKVLRHRLFECNPPIWWPPFSCNHNGKTAGSRLRDEQGRRVIQSFDRVDFICVVGHDYRVEDGRIAMGIDWMTRDELTEAIPPAYTRFIGRQMLEILEREATQ